MVTLPFPFKSFQSRGEKEMLSEILSKKTCASCRFCCSFRRSSLWETPLFDAETVKRLSERGYVFEMHDGYGRMILEDRYTTDDPSEEVPCYFLDSSSGCTLSGEDKPFDCKIWPLRLMRKENGDLVLALTPTCPAINRYSIEEMKQFAADGIGEQIFQYGKTHPYIIKEYREGFPELMTFRKSWSV